MVKLQLKIKKTDLLIGIVVAAIFILFSFQGFTIFESLEKVLYGIEMRLDPPRNLGENKIAIVNIDDKSLKLLGPWPWPRRIIAEMITILNQNGARLIGLDLLFSEKEQNQGLHEVRKLYQTIIKRNQSTDKDAWLLNTLEEIEKRLDNDKLLIETTKANGNIIMPLVGTFGRYDTELLLDKNSNLKRDTLKSTEFVYNMDNYIPVKEITTPFKELSINSRGLGHNNLYPNELMKGVTHLLFFNYRSHIIPSMPLRLAIDFLGKEPDKDMIQSSGLRLIKSKIPILKGEILIKFKGGRRSFPYYSFVDIYNVKKVPAVFDDKIVLIGYTAEEATSINTPVDPKMPRVELTANVLYDLMNGRFIKRPDNVIYIEVALLLLFSLFASFTLPRLSPANSLGATIAMIFLILLIGIISFLALDVWFKAIYTGLSLITIYIVFSIRDLIVSQRAMGITSKESIETNRMLGLSFQSQGLLDLAFEKFRKCPLDDAMKDVIYNLGLDYERKRMINKAVSVYEYISQKDRTFKDLKDRIPKLRKIISSLPGGIPEGKKEEKIVVADDLEIKPTVGRYEILEEVGQGAMGIVYKAKDPKINRLLAIKTIRFSDEFEEDRIRSVKNRFLREAEISGQLSHPSIVAVYDVGEDYDLTYMVMEFVEGEDLRNYCKKGSLLPLRKVLTIIADTASALDYAHRQKVIHRDVKPGNIMLLKDGKIKVTDFGIAKAVSSSETKSGIVLGTPNYMSPEQINAQEIDGRADIFSLGVVFFELLTGQLPFHGKTLTNLLYQITQVKHPSIREINPKVPKPCEQIINKALAKNPDQRFQNAGELAKYVKALIKKIDQVRAQPRG